MNGIDTALASLLATRVDSLLNIGPGSAATTQTGAPDVETAPTTSAPLAPPAPPQPSAQTALSAVALTLNAIVRSGGEATPRLSARRRSGPPLPRSTSKSALCRSSTRLLLPISLRTPLHRRPLPMSRRRKCPLRRSRPRSRRRSATAVSSTKHISPNG